MCRIQCLILCFADVESVCKCRAPNSPGGLNGRIASVIASLFQPFTPKPPARASYLEHLILPAATATTPTPAAVPPTARAGEHPPHERRGAARGRVHLESHRRLYPAARLARSLRLARDLALEFRIDLDPSAAHAARYTATSCPISAVLTAPLNTRWLARPSVAHSPAARAAPAGVATTTVKRPSFGPSAIWRSIHPRCSAPTIPRRPANVCPSNLVPAR